MAEIRTDFPPVKLIAGLLVVDEELRRRCLERLEGAFGRVDHQSRLEPFTFTDYYTDEMGEMIYRQYTSFEPLMAMGDLTRIKRLTNEMEAEMAAVDETGRPRRRVNIDPGYVSQSKLVLATTKDYNHRIYVADGIFEEATLHYQRPGGFEPFPWTYPDYGRPEACEFFNKVRDTYRRQLRSEKPNPTSDTPPAAEE